MSCEVCGLTTNLKSCGQCLKVNYCSREHQVAHWKEHRQWCNKSSSVINEQISCSTSNDDIIPSSNQSLCEQDKFCNSNNQINQVNQTARVDSNILCSSNFSQEVCYLINLCDTNYSYYRMYHLVKCITKPLMVVLI